MASLPDNHPVWRYSNPTEAHCFMMGMIPTHIEQLKEFISWYDKQIEVVYEIKQQGKTNPHYRFHLVFARSHALILLGPGHY